MYNCASGAIPLITPLESVPSPRTEPATCVPWPLTSDAPSLYGALTILRTPLETGNALMSNIWSLKSGCIPELFMPLSSPESATVTITPVPSKPDQEALIPAIIDEDCNTSAEISPSATSLSSFNSKSGSIHSISDCLVSHSTPDGVTMTLAHLQEWCSTVTSPRSSIPSGNSFPDNTTCKNPVPFVIMYCSISPSSAGITFGCNFADGGISTIP